MDQFDPFQKQYRSGREKQKINNDDNHIPGYYGSNDKKTKDRVIRDVYEKKSQQEELEKIIKTFDNRKIIRKKQAENLEKKRLMQPVPLSYSSHRV